MIFFFKKVNYLIDESVSIGKGANCTISLVHHFLSHHGFGAVNLHLHADNCSGQNKNRFMMQYLTWRVLAGLNDRIEISFMLVGHTKFAPDWCFGLFKQRFRRTKVGCLADIAKAVNDSAVVNFAQLVGREDGTTVVPQYDWAEFFGTFFKRNAFAGIKSLRHLVFSSSTPGIATVRETPDGNVKKLTLLVEEHEQWTPQPDHLPPRIEPPGLSHERKMYLYNKIREFCPADCQDIVCPYPTRVSSAPPPRSASPPPPPATPPTTQPPRKRRRGKA